MATECFREAGIYQGLTLLESIYCQHGCCGTTEDQRCCTEDERYQTFDHGKAWRIVAFALCGLVAILLVIVVACIIFKKKNKKRVRVSHRHGRQSRGQYSNRHTVRDHADIFAVTTLGEPYTHPKPPPYSTTVPEYTEQPSQDEQIPGYTEQVGFNTNAGPQSNHQPSTDSQNHDALYLLIRGGNPQENRNEGRNLPPPYTSFEAVQ